MKAWMVLAVVAAVSMAACAGSGNNLAGPSTVSVAKQVRPMAFDINIPDPALAVRLRGQYPDGVQMSPLQAQRTWDYTSAYGGSPNVYFGETSPKCEYIRAGIVVAPRAVAGADTFTSLDWPGIGLVPGDTYRWVGRFAFAEIPPPGSFVHDPSVTCNTPPVPK